MTVRELTAVLKRLTPEAEVRAVGFENPKRVDGWLINENGNGQMQLVLQIGGEL